MVNKLHYDAKFQELLVVQDIAGGNIDSADDNVLVKITVANRIAVLLTGMVAGTVDQDHTIKFYKQVAAGTGDVAIPFSYSKLTELTGA
ncbi:MAG: hypothetical protein HOD64_09180, partial [Candidatus Cloacimonetes bacterium]|nr:hypothetical protein [Candidatus Cloacimonadota bacterium]